MGEAAEEGKGGRGQEGQGGDGDEGLHADHQLCQGQLSITEVTE